MENGSDGGFNYVADESVAAQIIDGLRATGRSVFSISEKIASISDPEVLRVAVCSGTILLTEDKDFGELVYAGEAAHNGIVLIRLDGFKGFEKAARVIMAINAYEDQFPDAFSVIDHSKVRIRRMK